MAPNDRPLIIGGGVAGPALAIALARAGRQPILIERRADAHDKVCGEFISTEAADYLQHLGVPLNALGAKHIHGLRLYCGDQIATARLPFAASSLSRRKLDEALLTAAAAAGADVRRGLGARSLTGRPGSWTIHLDGGDAIAAPDVFLATGKHDLRGRKRPPGSQPDLIGFKMHWRLRPTAAHALAGHTELFLFSAGYAGLEPVEDDLANLCLVVRRRHFKRLGGQWDRLLADICTMCPALADRLDGARALHRAPLAIASIPYGHVATGSDGLWRLGDQAAVIPSFCGDGIAIALHSATVAAQAFMRGASAADYQRQLAADVMAQVRRATWLSKAAVRAPGQAVIGFVARMMPAALSLVAGGTRIRAAALRRGRTGQNAA